MYPCLKHSSSDTEELTYKSGFTTINYPFDAASDSGSVRLNSGDSKAVLCKKFEQVPKNVPSQPKVLDRETVADRCRIGIGGRNNLVFLEGHGDNTYRPKGKK